jgi:hypothetical protein
MLLPVLMHLLLVKSARRIHNPKQGLIQRNVEGAVGSFKAVISVSLFC